jgi:two-component system, sensor histidine kinase and response regulator
MAEPRILLVSNNALLVEALACHDGLPREYGLAQAGEPAQAAALLAETNPADFPLCLVDLGLPQTAVGQLVALAVAAGIPWLAVADHYSPDFREYAEALEAIDFVVAGSDDPYRLARSVARLLKNRGVRLLVVEDSAFMRLFLRRLLRRYQFRVHLAGNAAVAMRILEQRPDLAAIIIDYDMPGQNGVELTRDIRRRFPQREVCLIGVSGKAPRSISAEFLKNGADDYLHKPFEPEELYCRVLHGVEAVERMLEIKRLERLRHMFLSMLAHDLKSPAGGIVGAANLILDGVCGPVGDEAREMAAVISQAGRRLCTLAGNMQDLTRLESGQLLPAPVLGNIGELVTERARLAAATAAGKGIRLETEVDEVPPMAFDPDLVARLLDNLLSNALKFSPPQSLVCLELRLAGHEIVFRVLDSGPGVLPEERQRLFKPFERLSARPTAGEKSLGLGLAIAEGIVTAHGGRIWVENGDRQGARFCFALPLTLPMADAGQSVAT